MNAFIKTLNLRPNSRARIITIPNELLDEFVDPSTEDVRPERPARPLPLPQVLANLQQLHEHCDGDHVCGLPPHLQDFGRDLNDYIKLVKQYKEAK